MNTGPIYLKLQRSGSRRVWVPYFVLFIALAGTAVGAWYVSVTGRDKDQSRFENEVWRTIEQIEDRLAVYETLLQGTAGLFATHPELTADQFARYVDTLDLARLYPGLQGIGLSVRVPRDRLAEFQESMQQVQPGFHVWPPVEDDPVHAIKYLEPLDRRNREAIGYNMFSEPIRRAAMERARDTGEPAASGVVQLVQEIDEDVQAGFLIYLPLYEGDEIPAEVEQRREKLIGFVYSPFRADDLLENIFRSTQPGVAFRVYDGTELAPRRLLHTSDRWAAAVGDPGHKYRHIARMRVAGRIWTLDLRTLPGFGSAASQVNARWIAAGGVMLSLILFVLTLGQTRARIASERAGSDLRESRQELRRTEMRVRRLVESNIIGIVLGGAGGTINEANDAFLSMVGYSREDLVGGVVTLHELSSDSSEGVLDYALTELERKGRFGPWEQMFRTRDGRECPALVGMAMVEPSPTDWVAFVLDLSDRKHLETQLLEQKDTLETLNRVQRVVSAELKVDSVLAAVSGAAVGLTGSAEAGFFRHDSDLENDYKFVSPEHAGVDRGRVSRDHPAVKQALSEIRPDRDRDSEYEADGVLAVPVVSRFGSIVGALAVCAPGRDEFSDRDRRVMSTLASQAAIAIDNATLYEEARHDRNRAEKANRAKDQFLANLSHELRTPMTAIIGWTRMLQLGDLDDEEYEEAVAAISRSARAQAQLIEDILDVSRITTGKMKIEHGPVNLGKVIDAAIDSVWPSIEGKSLEFQYDPPVKKLVVVGDEQRLQQVIWNLLTNAVKFTDNGGRIDVVVTPTESDVIVEVRDTGEGISRAELPYLFERFRQADGTTTRNFGGLGLGLSLVDYIVRAHGGLATAESDGKGKGACFRIELPLASNSEGVDPQVDPALDSRRSVAGSSILLVERDREIREMVHVLLRRSGARVSSVRGADQARDHLANEDFDALISEVTMPGETGLDLIRTVRESSRAEQIIPAIAVTSHATEEEKRRILEAGYDACLVKPIEPGELIRAVEELIQRQAVED